MCGRVDVCTNLRSKFWSITDSTCREQLSRSSTALVTLSKCKNVKRFSVYFLNAAHSMPFAAVSNWKSGRSFWKTFCQKFWASAAAEYHGILDRPNSQMLHRTGDFLVTNLKANIRAFNLIDDSGSYYPTSQWSSADDSYQMNGFVWVRPEWFATSTVAKWHHQWWFTIPVTDSYQSPTHRPMETGRESTNIKPRSYSDQN